MDKVAPRDIFNDANFLKNLAFLTVHMQTGSINGLECNISEDDILSPDFLAIDEGSGDLFAPYGSFYVAETGEQLNLGRPTNSREPFPLFFTDESEGIYDIFYDDGTLRGDIEEILTSDEPSRVNLDPRTIMAQSIAMKGIGKLALNIVDRMSVVAGFGFDQEQYGPEGITLEMERGHFNLKNERLVTFNGQNVELRSPAITSDEDLWPLEFAIGDNSYARVYDKNGDFSPEFLAVSQGNELKPQEPEATYDEQSPRLRR